MKLMWLIKTSAIALFLAIAFMGLAGHDAVVAAQDESNKIEGMLLNQFTTDGNADFIVRFAEQADLSAAYAMDWAARGKFVYDTLTEVASKSQVNAKAILEAGGLKYQTLIGGNDLYVWGGNLTDAYALAALPEVYYIRATRIYYLDPVEIIQPMQNISWAGDYLVKDLMTTVRNSTDATTDWGITDSKANQAWVEGARGAGIKVANIDTGVQWDHPALVGQFACAAGNDPACWADPSNICGGTACDNNGHGTHTMGTMVAKDDPSLTYIAGMAPDATWIACKGCESSSCSSYALTTCADWILAPGGDTANRPDVVNNSWGGGGGESWYQTYVNNWRAAGIFPAFSAGNAGPSCNTIGSPGDYQESFASAAHASNRTIASFSSRGPSTYGHDPYTKPNISAPGVSICSTVPTNGWNCGYSGTSMASPHTAGAVAQLWSCAPALVGQIDATFQALQNSTDVAPAGTCGAPPDGQGNYTFGYGYLDVLTLVDANCGITGSGTMEGHVYDQIGSPIEGASVIAQPATLGNSINATTDPNGFYSMDLAAGTYGVTASKANYSPHTVAGVEVIADQTTVQDFVLAYLGAWTQIPLGAGCPDWFRSDMEYFAGTGLAYILGGRTGTSTYGDIYSFDPVVHTCTDTGANMPTPISNYTIGALNDGSANLLCTFGGRDSSGNMTLTVQCYNPATNAVVSKANLPAAFTGYLPGGVAVVNNKAYVFGGFRSTSLPYIHAYTYEYDPVANTYTQRGNLTLGRGYIEVAVVDGLIYAFGGDTFDGTNLVAQSIAEVYNPSAGTWNDAAVTDLATASGEGRGFGFDTSSGYDLAGKIVLAGGGIWQSDTYAVVSYDTTTNTYDETFPDLNVERRDQAGFFVPGDSGTMWVFGGYSAAAGYGGDNPPYAPPEYFEVALVGPAVPKIIVVPSTLTADLFPDTTTTIPVTINNIGQAALDWSTDDEAAWLSENPTSGTVQSGDSVIVDVTFNAAGLTPGQYLASLNINSNDPDQPTINMPVTLTVIAVEPDIEVYPLVLELTLMSNEIGMLPLRISNVGSTNLTWNITDNGDWLSENLTDGIIAPGGWIDLMVFFNSTGLPAGQYLATIEVTSDDPDEPIVDVQATLIVIAPDIVVTAPALEMTLPPDQLGTLSINITNAGNSALDWVATDGAAWLSELPYDGTLLPDQSIEVVVTFNSSGLIAGEYQTDLVIGSNDPDDPEITLPATLTVVEPDIEVTAPPLEMTLLPDQSGTISFTIANIGGADLDWSVIDTATWLSELPSSGTIAPGNSIDVEVTFDSTGITPGTHAAEVVVASNDSDQPEITLAATLTVIAPEIEVIAPPLEVVLLPDQTGSLSFTIANIGTSDLVWNVADGAPWLSEAPASGTILPADSTEVEVTFNSASLAPDVYTTTVVISSNDLDTPEVSLPATLTVVAPESDLAVELSADPEAVVVGEMITYTMVITNYGPQDATGVMLVDILPTSVTFTTASLECAEEAGVVSCDIGNLAAENSISLTILVKANAKGVAENTASVSSDNYDPDLTNNTSTVGMVIHPLIHSFYLPTIQRH